MTQAARHFAPLSRRDALSCAAASVALLLLSGCEHRGGDVPFQSIDVSGADWGGDFRLQDAYGRTVQLADFRGRCVMLLFGFTQCPDVCPTAPSRAAAVMQRLGAQAELHRWPRRPPRRRH